MAGFTLKIFNGSEIFEYTGTQIAGSADYEEQLADELIEQATIELQLISENFLGVTTYPDLAAGPFRALLTYNYAGTKFETLGIQEIINGRILRETIQHARETNIWILTIVNDAIDEMQRRMELEEPLLTSGATAMETAVVATDGGVDVASRNWYDLEDLFQTTAANISDLAFDYQADNPFSRLSIVYDDSGTDRTIIRDLPVYVTYADPESPSEIPVLNLWQLTEVLIAMFGWKFRAAYGSFPSELITVTVLSDLKIEPVVPSPEIDELDTQDDRFIEGYTLARFEDFGISYSNSKTEEELGPGGVPANINAVYAADRKEYDRNGEASNSGLVDIELHVFQSDTVTGTLLNQQPDPTNHPNYLEDVAWARPMIAEKNSIWICSIVDVTGTNRAVVNRQPQNPATGQVGSTAEYWAIELFKNYAYSSARRFVVRGKVLFDTIADLAIRPVVGDQLSGLRLYDEHWRLTSISWEVPLMEAEIEIDRPDGVPVAEITQPFICPPRNIETTVNVHGPDPSITVDWLAPVLGCGQQLPVEYELIFQVPLLGTQTFTVSALTFTNTFTGGGVGPYDGSIRSKAANGTFSAPIGFSALVIDEDTT